MTTLSGYVNEGGLKGIDTERAFRLFIRHYHLEVQANPKEIAQKNDANFSSLYGRNGRHFLKILS